MLLTPDNLTIFAARYYDNPGCLDANEFEEDLLRLTYLARLFSKYADSGTIKEQLVINHFVVLFNVFPHTIAIQLIFMKLAKYLSYVKPFLVFLNKCPDIVLSGVGNPIYTSDIPMDKHLVEKLRRI